MENIPFSSNDLVTPSGEIKFKSLYNHDISELRFKFAVPTIAPSI